MPYNKDTFLDEMIRYLHKAENSRLPKEERIEAALGAYELLRGADAVWDTLGIDERGKAYYYWKVCLDPLTEKLGLILDGGEPKRIETRVVPIKRKE